MKKILAAAIAAALAVSLLASCGSDGKDRSAAEDKKPAATAAVKSNDTDEKATASAAPSPENSEAPGETGERSLQTAEEAANDQVTIQNEIDSIKGLIDEGLYDDAQMQINALRTKNLTEADLKLIEQYAKEIAEKLGSELTD